jgi:hypothetical protein
VAGSECDPFWEAFVTAMLATGSAHEQPSRYGNKPALYIQSREVAHLEAPGIIDLRITRQGWALVKGEYANHPAIVTLRGGIGSSFAWARYPILTC